MRCGHRFVTAALKRLRPEPRGELAGDDLIDKVHEVLAVIGIPREEFYQFEKETDDEEWTPPES